MGFFGHQLSFATQAIRSMKRPVDMGPERTREKRTDKQVFLVQVGVTATVLLSSIALIALDRGPDTNKAAWGVIGVVLGYVCHRTGSLVAPIVGHVVTNAIVLIVSGFAANLDGM